MKREHSYLYMSCFEKSINVDPLFSQTIFHNYKISIPSNPHKSSHDIPLWNYLKEFSPNLEKVEEIFEKLLNNPFVENLQIILHITKLTLL